MPALGRDPARTVVHRAHPSRPPRRRAPAPRPGAGPRRTASRSEPPRVEGREVEAASCRRSTRSASTSPSTGVNLKPWPEKPQASSTRGASGCGPTTKFSSGVRVYQQTASRTCRSPRPGNSSASVPATSGDAPGVGRSHGREVHRCLDVAGVALRRRAVHRGAVGAVPDPHRQPSRPEVGSTDGGANQCCTRRSTVSGRSSPPSRSAAQRPGASTRAPAVVAAARGRDADTVVSRRPAGHGLVVPQLGTGRGSRAAQLGRRPRSPAAPCRRSGSHSPTTPSGGRSAGNRACTSVAVEHRVLEVPVPRRLQAAAEDPGVRQPEEQPAGAAQQRLAGLVGELRPELVGAPQQRHVGRALEVDLAHDAGLAVAGALGVRAGPRVEAEGAQPAPSQVGRGRAAEAAEARRRRRRTSARRGYWVTTCSRARSPASRSGSPSSTTALSGRRPHSHR